MDKGTTVKQIFEATRFIERNITLSLHFLYSLVIRAKQKQDIDKTIAMITYIIAL